MRSFIIILFLVISCSSYSQSGKNILLIRGTLANKIEENKWEFARTYDNEYDLIFSRLFLFYKRFISSQDANSCSFTPSCSIYAINAIKKQGVIVGLINFFDRFTRCNSLSPENYKIDLKSKLLIDPVRGFNFEKY